MDRKKALSAGLAAVALSAGAVVLSAGTALAADCEFGGSTSCVAVTYQTSHVKSIRVNGRCLIGPSAKHPTVVVGRFERPHVLTYGGTRCEGNTHNVATVKWGNEDSQGYRWVWIEPA